MEYYHLPWVHPGLVKVSPIDAHHRWQGTGMYAGFCTVPDRAGHRRGRLAAAGSRRSAGSTTPTPRSARFVWLFPNVAVNVLPNHLFIIHARPVAPRLRSRRPTCSPTPSRPAAPEQERAVDGIARFWDAVNREDIGIVERVQAGLDSTPFPGGRLCYRFEESLHRFQNMVIDRMVGRRASRPATTAETRADVPGRRGVAGGLNPTGPRGARGYRAR